MSNPAPAPPAPADLAERSAAPFRGWRIVFVGIAAQMLSMGLISAYGVFVRPVLDEFGSPVISVSAGFAVFTLVGGLIGPVLGPALDRRSIRAIMLWGVGLMWAGFLALSLARSMWQVGALLVVAATGIMMYGTLPVHVMLVRWFAAQRGRALSIAALGIGVPGLFMPPLAAVLVETIGWRGAVAVMASGCAVVAIPLIARGVIGHPRDVGQHPDGIPPSAGEAVHAASSGSWPSPWAWPSARRSTTACSWSRSSRAWASRHFARRRCSR
jgi:MFS family permease